MKLRSALALTLVLIYAPAHAQETRGTSPLSVAKGGTGGATASAARTSLGAGTVSQVNTSGFLSGGPITTTGTVNGSYVPAIAPAFGAL